MKDINRRSPGRPRTDEKTEPTNEKILKTAARLFLESGYKEVSIDDVATSSGVTKATVYYYYDTKADLFTETMVQMMERINERIQSMLTERIPLKERLLKVTQTHLKATLDIDLDGFMKGAKSTLSSVQIQKMHEAEDNMYRSIEKAFETAIQNGEIGNINPTFAAHSYIALLKVGNYRDRDNRPIFHSFQRTTQEIVSFFWNGLNR